MTTSTTLTTDPVVQKIGRTSIVPVVTLDDVALAPQLGAALLAGGVPVAEITLRTEGALSAIARMATACPDVSVGAGTVLTIEQAAAAIDAGATFIVTPGFDDAVVDHCLAKNVPIIPGVMTPSDINRALAKGLRLLKFFPAKTAGGTAALKAIGAPYHTVQFIPTGGITPQSLPDYLRLPQVFACGGSWLTARPLLQAGQFDEITRLAQSAVKIVNAVRSV